MDEQEKRDTHFQGFARLLREDIRNLAVAHYEQKMNNSHDLFDYERQVEMLIAQRAYDLVALTMSEVDVYLETYPVELNRYHRANFIRHIADLAAQPEQREE